MTDAFVVMDARQRPSVSKVASHAPFTCHCLLSHALQGFGFVEFQDIEAAAAARAAMDGAMRPVPAPQSRSPPRLQCGRLLEMGFSPQHVARALELGGGSEEAALALLLDGAVDSEQQPQQQQQQQQQQTQPLSVRFAKVPSPAALPQSRPRDDFRGRDADDVSVCSARDSVAADVRAASESVVIAGASQLPAHIAPHAGTSAALMAGGGAAAADASPRDWVILQHPDSPAAVAFGNIVTREFSLQPPTCNTGSKPAGSEGC